MTIIISHLQSPRLCDLSFINVTTDFEFNLVEHVAYHYFTNEETGKKITRGLIMVEPDFELIYKTTLFQNIFCCTSTYPKTS